MKNIIFFFCCFIIVQLVPTTRDCTFIIKDCICQWEPDVRLTTGTGNSKTSDNNAWCVASSGAIVHTVWYDDRDGNTEIYYKQSTNYGINWTPGIRLTSNTFESQEPSIAITGSLVHIVWMDNRNGNYEIYYKRSINAGTNWESDVRLTNYLESSQFPSITVYGQNIHIVWEDTRDGNFEIYYKRSTDGGINWGSDRRLTNTTNSSYHPSVAVFGSVVSVVWYEGSKIYFKQTTNNGTDWGTNTLLTNNSVWAQQSSIAVNESNIHVVWAEYRDGNYEIYYKRSTNGGINWGSDARLTTQSDWSYLPSLAVSGYNIHIVWEDDRDGNYEIYYKQSTNNGVSWTADVQLTNNSANSLLPSITISGTIVHVVWTDYRNGNTCIYYKRNPTGNSIGIKNISSEVPEKFELGENYPNPFNQSTMFNFQCSMAGIVQVKVFDIMGREVTTLVNEYLQAGIYEVLFDAGNLPSGMYFYQLKTEKFTDTKKLILLK